MGPIRKRRVLHLITGLSLGGAETMLYRLISHMDRNAFEPSVISLKAWGVMGDKILRLGVQARALGMNRFVPNPMAILRLALVLRRDRPDVVQTWMYHSDLMGLIITRIVRKPKLVWCIRCSDVPFHRYRPRTGWVMKACSRLSTIPDAIVVNSIAGMKAHLRLGYSPHRMQWIPNGIDLFQFRPDPEARISVRREFGLPEETKIIGLVARWDPLKDHATFFRAASLLARKYKDLHFLLAGQGMEWRTPGLASLIREFGVQDRVVLSGDRDDIPTIDAALDVACSSSSTEGFPTAIAEAMACGIPCVVTDVGDSAMIIGQGGRVVPPRDPTALAWACGELLEMDPVSRQAMGRQARDFIAKNYELNSIVKKYEALYTQLVK